MFRKKLTEVAVDSFTDYLQERFEKLKQYDLDKNGERDVDQVIEILGRCARKVKDTVNATDFPAIATGIECVLTGATQIRNSIDREKVGELGIELAAATKKLAEIGQLTLSHVKEQGEKGN